MAYGDLHDEVSAQTQGACAKPAPAHLSIANRQA